MANATAKVPMATVPWGISRLDRPLDNAVTTYYPGQMICRNSSGNAVHAADTAGLTFDGINMDSDRIQVLSGEAAGDRKVPVDRPWRFVMAIASAAAGDEGKAVYVVDNQTVGYTTSHSILVGWVDQVLSSTTVLIVPLWSPLQNVAVSGNTLAFAGSTGANSITMPDNLADALHASEGSNVYLKFTTTDGSEVSLLRGPDATGTTNTGGSAQVLGGIGGSSSGAGGTATVTGGAGTAGNSAGGAASVTGGAGQGSAAGGAASLVGGVGGGTGAGGAVTVTGGAGGATSGNGAAVTITGGAGTTSGTGANVNITGGAGAGGTSAGGHVNLTGGAAVSTGAPGEVQVNGNSGLIPVLVSISATDASRAVYIATRACRLKAVSYMHTTGSTSGTLTVEKLTGTTAAGSGTALLTGTIDISSSLAANTVSNGTLIATVASLTLAAGDRLSIKLGGTLTSLAGAIATLMVAPA